MASTDATPLPIKNQALRITFPLWLTTGLANSGAAGLDSEVSKDGGTFADCTNEATEIASASGTYYLDLTSTEMNADTVAVMVKSSTTNAITYKLTIYPQSAGKIKVDLQTVATQTVTAAAGVTFLASVGTATTSTAQTGDSYARIGASGAGLTAIGDTRLANLDATVSSRSTFTGGAVASVTGNVGGNVVGSVGSVVGLTPSNLDVAVSSRLATAGYTAPPSASTISAQVNNDLTTAHGSGSYITATGFATSAQAVKLLAATYDSASLSGSTLTLSNGATMTVTSTGRVTA